MLVRRAPPLPLERDEKTPSCRVVASPLTMFLLEGEFDAAANPHIVVLVASAVLVLLLRFSLRRQRRRFRLLGRRFNCRRLLPLLLLQLLPPLSLLELQQPQPQPHSRSSSMRRCSCSSCAVRHRSSSSACRYNCSARRHSPISSL
ncbi:hypothetical protein QYE76_066863 [Lolium multiflorum]|uniref:Uncharacterized protein n=1 Tax=Lolium multiflorum TaxID=4521 RepID=A0AAD8SCG0_LOLMU|nr:hypothetical protein QYE76_066863 [Lolium multiflorum]